MSSVKKHRKMFFFSCHKHGTKKKLSPYKESNFRPSDSVLRCSTTKPLYGEQGLLKLIWHASCILLGSGMSIASCKIWFLIGIEFVVLLVCNHLMWCVDIYSIKLNFLVLHWKKMDCLKYQSPQAQQMVRVAHW